MRKPTHMKKFSPDAAVLWYLTALAGLLLFCFVPLMPENAGGPPAAEPAEVSDGPTSGDGMTASGAVIPGETVTADVRPVFLMQGDCGAEVYRLQTQLAELGYDVGDCSGVYTQQTASAVRRFQLDCGFIGDGVCSAAVSHALAYLVGGMSGDGDAVSEDELCRALEAAGCWNPIADSGGEAVPQDIRLRNALILFQRTHGLCGSGQPDYATLCALGLAHGWQGTAADDSWMAAEAAQFDLRCRLLCEALADYVLRCPAAYDLYTLTACAAVLCNRVEHADFPGSFDAVCRAGLALPAGETVRVPQAEAVEQRSHDLLLLRAAEDALRAHLSGGGGDLSRGALYVLPAGTALPPDAALCLSTGHFVFFR